MQTDALRPRVPDTTDPHNGIRQMRGIFWDTDIEQLDPEKNKRFIIARMLEKGGIRGLIWTEAVYTRAEIIDVICHRRDLSPVVRNFYIGRYHIPKEAVTVPGNWGSPAFSSINDLDEQNNQSPRMEQIVIYVSGGMVQDVMASMPNINVSVVDFDIPPKERVRDIALPFHIY